MSLHMTFSRKEVVFDVGTLENAALFKMGSVHSREN